MAHKLWTVQEVETLRRLYPDCKTETLALLFGRNIVSVCSKAKVIGIKKSEGFKNSPLSGRLLKGNTIGSSTRFNGENGGWNKGMKRSDYMSPKTIERCSKTQFKKGQDPHNTVDIGHERINADGYLEVKVNHFKDGNSKNKNFVFKHRLLWESINGPIPDGMMVVINGDKLYFTIDDLEMITKRENVIRNNKCDTAIVKRYLRIKDPEMVEKIITELPGLIELKRTNLNLNTRINNYENNN